MSSVPCWGIRPDRGERAAERATARGAGRAESAGLDDANRTASGEGGDVLDGLRVEDPVAVVGHVPRMRREHGVGDVTGKRDDLRAERVPAGTAERRALVVAEYRDLQGNTSERPCRHRPGPTLSGSASSCRVR